MNNSSCVRMITNHQPGYRAAFRCGAADSDSARERYYAARHLARYAHRLHGGFPWREDADPDAIFRQSKYRLKRYQLAKLRALIPPAQAAS